MERVLDNSCDLPIMEVLLTDLAEGSRRIKDLTFIFLALDLSGWSPTDK